MVRLVAIAVLSIVVMIAAAMMIMGSGSEAPVAAEKAARQTDAASERASAFYSGEERTVIRRDSSGQFRLTAQVNGEDIRFLVDTGADMVALTVDDAEHLGLDFDPSNFQPITKTASGVGMGAEVMIDRLEVGGAEFANVPALVVEGLGTNLLGQTVLRRLGKVELAGDKMTIHKN